MQNTGRILWTGNAVSYGFRTTGADLLSLSTQIKTFTERVGDQSTVDSMHQLVQTAEKVVFLGFAFHQQNMELIRPDGGTEVKCVFATAKGISDSDLVIVTQQIEVLFNDPKLRKHTLLKSLTCSGFFDEYWRSLALS